MNKNEIISFLEKENFEFNKVSLCYEKRFFRGILKIGFFYDTEDNKLMIHASSNIKHLLVKDFYEIVNLDDFLETYRSLV